MPVNKFDVEGEFHALHGRYPLCDRRPVIGITANFADDKATLAHAYYRSVLAAGGVPLLIPPYPEREALIETLSYIDALLLTGGADIDPRYMGEEPDYSLLVSTYKYMLYKLYLIAVKGIFKLVCRINVLH